MRTDAEGSGSSPALIDALLDLVPTSLYSEPGEVLYSGATAFEQPSPIYLLGFNPGGDPTRTELTAYTIGADVQASRGIQRRDWTAFEDDWREFGPGAVAFQRRVRHLFAVCGIVDPRKVPASNAMFVRSARIETLAPQQRKALLQDCWLLHERVISALGVRVVICLGQDAGRWVRAQVGAEGLAAIDTFVEANGRKWRSTTHQGNDGTQVVTLTHPSVADWTNPRTDPTGLVVRALERAPG